MADKYSVFEAHDPAAPASKDKQGDKRYTGVERRKGNRRRSQDRREEVRFEFDKEDRRQEEGRRGDDKTPKFW